VPWEDARAENESCGGSAAMLIDEGDGLSGESVGAGGRKCFFAPDEHLTVSRNRSDVLWEYCTFSIREYIQDRTQQHL
jgi:hypothetical protein